MVCYCFSEDSFEALILAMDILNFYVILSLIGGCLLKIVVHEVYCKFYDMQVQY